MNAENEFSLEVGYVDKDNVTHTSYTLKEMTGKEEEAIHKSDVKGNSAKAITRLLAYCVTSIGSLTPKSVGKFTEWEKIIKSLYAGDVDNMLLNLRRISIGEEVTVQHLCPFCKTKLNTTFNVDELPKIPFKGNTVIPFTLKGGYVDGKGEVHKEGTLRLPTHEDRELAFPLAKKNIAYAETFMLSRLCTFNDGYPIDDTVMRALTVKDRKYLTGILKENNFGVDTVINSVCSNCGEELQVNMQSLANDFFSA